MFDAKALVAAGWKQVSRKSKTIACLPEGTTGRDLLRDLPGHEDMADGPLSDAELDGFWLRVFARSSGRCMELTRSEFDLFKKAGGEAAR